MKATQKLHELGQSVWLDNITRDLLTSGTLKALHRRILADGAHIEPDNLRPGDQSSTHYIQRSAANSERGSRVGGLFFELGNRRSGTMQRTSPPSPLGPHQPE